MRRDGLINHTQEVLGRHVRCDLGAGAVASTVETVYITAERGLPKELLQRVQLLKVLAAQPLKLEYDAFAEVHEENFFINDNLNNIPLANSASGR